MGSSAQRYSRRLAADDTLRHLRVAVAHDYLTQRGGAERLTLALLRAFPNSELFTAVADLNQTFPEYRAHRPKTSWLQDLPPIRRDPRIGLPLLPKAWASTVIEGADVVIASSAGFAHGVSTRAPKLVYCHNPPRWLYQSSDYLLDRSRLTRAGLRVMDPYLRRWDQLAARSATRYIANSTVVAERVRTAYGINARIIHPPVFIEPNADQVPVLGIEPGYWLSIARARGYKNTTLAQQAALMTGARLVCVGEQSPTRSGGDGRVTNVGSVSDEQLRWLYANCAGILATAIEDFGLVPIEAAAFGAPTVALSAGGYLDTVVDGRTGKLAAEATPESVAVALSAAMEAEWDRDLIRSHAKSFSFERFAQQMREEVRQALV